MRLSTVRTILQRYGLHSCHTLRNIGTSYSQAEGPPLVSCLPLLNS